LKISSEAESTRIFGQSPFSPTARQKQQAEQIKPLLTKYCGETNDKIERLEAIHLATPSPSQKPLFVPTPFADEPPIPLYPKSIGKETH
jgi:hypothetical protein